MGSEAQLYSRRQSAVRGAGSHGAWEKVARACERKMLALPVPITQRWWRPMFSIFTLPSRELPVISLVLIVPWEPKFQILKGEAVFPALDMLICFFICFVHLFPQGK